MIVSPTCLLASSPCQARALRVARLPRSPGPDLPEFDGTTGYYFDFRRRELTRWFGVDRTDWSEELDTGSLALCGCGIEHDPLCAAA